MPESYDAIVVGAGIVGLAHAYELARRGLRVLVVERGRRALGASVRNFGMIWPIGQPPGEMREIALQSREVWREVLAASGIWHEACGSLHLAYHDDELGVLEEFVQRAPEYGAEIITPKQARERSPVIREAGLKGAMWSPRELCVDPRRTIAGLPAFLETFGVQFRFGAAVTQVQDGVIGVDNAEIRATKIFLCTGDDFETLFPSRLAAHGMTRSKLQMLRAKPRRPGYRIGTHLCAGLTLGHYANFRICERLTPLLERFAVDYPDHVRWGIHLLVSQHESGEITIGDSHEYGLSPDPFLREEIDRLILSYLDSFLPLDDFEIVERWSGTYAKHTNRGYIAERLFPSVTVVTGIGGAGMTLSFGVACKVVEEALSGA